MILLLFTSYKFNTSTGCHVIRFDFIEIKRTFVFNFNASTSNTILLHVAFVATVYCIHKRFEIKSKQKIVWQIVSFKIAINSIFKSKRMKNSLKTELTSFYSDVSSSLFNAIRLLATNDFWRRNCFHCAGIVLASVEKCSLN